MNPLELGFRRRCGWCGVVLRGWQLNLCRLCKAPATGDAGVYLASGGPPCSRASRWEAEPDRLRRRLATEVGTTVDTTTETEEKP